MSFMSVAKVGGGPIRKLLSSLPISTHQGEDGLGLLGVGNLVGVGLSSESGVVVCCLLLGRSIAALEVGRLAPLDHLLWKSNHPL